MGYLVGVKKRESVRAWRGEGKIVAKTRSTLQGKAEERNDGIHRRATNANVYANSKDRNGKKLGYRGRVWKRKVLQSERCE